MNFLSSLGRWLAHPFHAARRLFPFSQEGRQTLVYLIFAGAGPALTLIGISILDRTQGIYWPVFAEMARIFGWSLFVIVASLGLYVSIRSFKIGPGGMDFTSKEDAVSQAAKEVAKAGVEKAAEFQPDPDKQ